MSERNGGIHMKNELSQIISQSRSLVFFGGAGVSTESGIPDFRKIGRAHV